MEYSAVRISNRSFRAPPLSVHGINVFLGCPMAISVGHPMVHLIGDITWIKCQGVYTAWRAIDDVRTYLCLLPWGKLILPWSIPWCPT